VNDDMHLVVCIDFRFVPCFFVVVNDVSNIELC